MGASGPSAIGDLLAGGTPGQGSDPARAALEQLASQIRDMGGMADTLASTIPAAAQEVAQIKMLLKQIIVKAAQLSSQGTPSGNAVPTGASMGPAPQ